MNSIRTGNPLFLLFPIIIAGLLAANLPTSDFSRPIAVTPASLPYPPEPENFQHGSRSWDFPENQPASSVKPGVQEIRALQPPAIVAPPAIVTPPALPALEEFVRTVVDGDPGALRGLYVQDVLSLRILQQPPGDPAFIAFEEGTATLFQDALSFRTFGLLAHNFLSGREFFSLQQGQDLFLVFGDGGLKRYQVSEIADYQRLNVADLRSDFLGLADNSLVSVDQLFTRFYQNAEQLVLQTCIERAGLPSWGVRFIRAVPVNQ